MKGVAVVRGPEGWVWVALEMTAPVLRKLRDGVMKDSKQLVAEY